MWTVLATAFVLGALVVVFYGLIAVFTHHPDRFRDPLTGKPLGESPHLEMRDEFEATHETGSPHLEGRNEFEHPHAYV